jgi:hypothetical protein
MRGKSRGGHSVIGSVWYREYEIWRGCIRRCTNPTHRYYQDYGGRGITVCDRWLQSFEAFIEDMGHAPSGYTLDRRNNDLGYGPDNCIWATAKQQANNRRPPKRAAEAVAVAA